MQPITGWPRALGATAAAALVGILVSVPAAAQRVNDISPEIQQRSDELDVPFVPSHDNVLKAMFDMAKPTRDDFLIDLGSGDGRIVISAAHKFGTRGLGVDLNEGLVKIARDRADRAGVASRARFEVRDLYKTDIRSATVLTMYLLPEIVQDLRDRLMAELRPGTRIVSHDYHMGDWRPDESRVVEISERPKDPEESIVYFWVVPARIAGNWKWTLNYPRYSDTPLEYAAAISQHFQDVDGQVEVFPSTGRIRNGRLAGTRIAFSADVEVAERIVRHDFAGTIDGERITGTVRLSGGMAEITLPWEARRTKGGE